MSEQSYSYLNCAECDDDIQAQFNCDKNNIFANLEIDSENAINMIRHYKKRLNFSGCPFAFYVESQNIINIIIAKKHTSNFDISKEPFIVAELIMTFLEDANVQQIGEIREAREKK